ncbi:Hypothetical protein PHPALM_18831, partial [Phytophthora palmivora]
MESDVAAGRLDALVLKLRHPLAKVRSRALHSLLFKLRERLVRLQELEPLQNALIPGLLECLEAPLELEALHVLQLLVQSQSEVVLASLQHFGAAQKLQRAANNNPELQSSYEKVLRQIYVTKIVSVQDEKIDQPSTSEEEEVQEIRVNKVLLDQRRAPKVDELEARGWKFAQVTLTSVDEQYLFEFEVKLQLRTEIQDIVEACATFRNELLRNFPAEVFLQRPAVLQYLLHLVQQPILPGSPGTRSGESDGDILMDRAMEVSLGVNYFDEMLNATFSNKRGNLSGAVVMASLKAIESFVHALKLTRRTCLDPTYVVHASKVQVELFDSYDSRRVLYPRVSVEVGDDGSLSEQRGDGFMELGQYSLSGAIYRIFMSILPMLRSARHPRLHLLNILITALPDLLEKGSTEASVQELDKMRLERILENLSGICQTVVLEQTRNPLIDDDLGFTYSMAWKLVELVFRLLRFYSPSQYHVEGSSNEAGSNSYLSTDDKLRIAIPRLLWQAVKSWITNPKFSELAAKEWNDESLLQHLSKIDGTIPAFVNLKQSSLRDARLIRDFVEFAKVHREQLADFGQWEKPAIFNLEAAQKTIQTRCAFDDADMQTIADATLQTIWSKLTSDSGKLADSDVEAIQLILCDLLKGLDEKKASTSHGMIVARFFGSLMDLLDSLGNEAGRLSDQRRQFFTEIVCEPNFLTLLLTVLARNEEPNDHVIGAALWSILRAALNQFTDSSEDKLLLLQP